ncbi:MAG: nucleotidyltransferase family protein [Clostridiales bacterium]|nr:nucleotidyltransferase family protein [Clostridiales bacterium]
MKLAAIICEFNPLHTGHKRLLDYAKTVADNVVCIMSGNFTQRGLPSCADKYSRARHAILAGADLVVELPTVFATASAENFAYGGIAIAEKIGADCLVFGSECGDVDVLKSCVEKIENCETNKLIQQEVAKGVSYPKAVASATGLDVLDKPNNVLAVEYLKALRRANSTIVPLTLKREDNFNTDNAQEYASSKALRDNAELRDKYTFDYVINDIDDCVVSKYCSIAPSILATATKEQLEQIEGVTEGLHNRIFNADKSHGYEYMLEEIKTKRYTRLKLQRIILYQILGITKDAVALYKSQQPCVKVLAVRSSKTTLLQGVDNESDEITQRADRLYATLSGKTAPTKLVKIDC